jgi:transcriptional regulator with XRE-family HTH domain
MKKNQDQIELFLTQVGLNIKKQRVKKGLTLEALGEDLGLGKSNMFRIEQGKNITLISLLKISAYLEVHPIKFFQNTNDVSVEEIEEYLAKK